MLFSFDSRKHAPIFKASIFFKLQKEKQYTRIHGFMVRQMFYLHLSLMPEFVLVSLQLEQGADPNITFNQGYGSVERYITPCLWLAR